jgi:hypothetical protein
MQGLYEHMVHGNHHLSNYHRTPEKKKKKIISNSDGHWFLQGLVLIEKTSNPFWQQWINVTPHDLLGGRIKWKDLEIIQDKIAR